MKIKNILSVIICLFCAISPAYCEIVDDFADSTLDKNLKIKTYTYKPIYDNFGESNKNKSKHHIVNVNFQETLPNTINKPVSKKLVVIDTNSMLAIPVRIKKHFSTKNKIQEGEYIEFETIKDVTINNKFYPAGTTVKARIETISGNKMKGVPSDLAVGNFSIDEIPLGGEISKMGANRSIWLRPVYMGLSVVYGIGIPFMFIRGGHAKIKTSEIYTLYAE